MNKVDVDIDLYGEYKIEVFDNDDNLSYQTDWCRNTILSGGLVALHTNEIPNLLRYLDMGTSSALSGTAGYVLSGVKTPTTDLNFINVARAESTSAIVLNTTKVYYNKYLTNKATSSISFNEFAIKPSSTEPAFARNTFNKPLILKVNEYLQFTYRLRLNWRNIDKRALKINTADSYSYFVPITSSVYQIPYDRTYYDNNKLIVVKDSRPLPSFGQSFIVGSKLGILNNSTYSTFNPTFCGASIDHNTKTYTVSTAYANVSATPSGIYKDISYLILSKDGVLKEPNCFLATTFKFPIALYNVTTDFSNTPYSSYVNSVYATNFYRDFQGGIYSTINNKFNTFNFYYNYSWREVM